MNVFIKIKWVRSGRSGGAYSGEPRTDLILSHFVSTLKNSEIVFARLKIQQVRGNSQLMDSRGTKKNLHGL